MLTTLLCLGILGTAPAGMGDIIAIPERTVSAVKVASDIVVDAPLPLGAYEWPSPFDPSDRTPYAFEFNNLLGDDETVEEIVQLTMLAAGANVGVEIDDSAGREPIIATDGKAVQVWFLTSQPTNAAFTGEGVKVGVEFTVRTSSDPYKQFQRTGVLTVRQQ